MLLFLPLGCLRGQFNIFRALFLRPGSSKLVLCYQIGRVFGVLSSWISEDPHNYLSLSTCGRDKHVVKIHSLWWSLELISFREGERCRSVKCRFCKGRDGDGHLFWDCTFPPILHVRELPEFMSRSGILVQPALIDANLRRARMPYVRRDWREKSHTKQLCLRHLLLENLMARPGDPGTVLNLVW